MAACRRFLVNPAADTLEDNVQTRQEYAAQCEREEAHGVADGAGYKKGEPVA